MRVDVPNTLSDKLAASLSNLIHKLEEAQPSKPSQIVRLVKEAQVTAADLMPFADFEHPGTDSYGRRMVYKGANYEIMVMSWNPGDFSAIHDHGYTMWGAVQIFGRAEHATFRWEDEHMSTLARWVVEEGDVLGVGHSLVHQMGNRDSDPFVSLHVYGHINDLDNITGEARIFDLHNQEVQRVNGGAFFNLKEDKIVKKEEGPKADFPTLLRFNLESYKRMARSNDPFREDYFKTTFSQGNASKLISHLDSIISADNQKVNNSIQWKILNRELREAAEVQADHETKIGSDDTFHKYAEVYDEVIGHVSLESFMESYVDFFLKKYDFDLAQNYTLAIGCGTGLVERRMMDKYGCADESLYGIDISESMISVAKGRIHADVGDLLGLDPGVRKWNLAFSGLNVYQYLPHQRLEEAIQKTSDILEEDGYFLGDFITPDHIRWYPSVMYGADKQVISLRTPQLIEDKGASFMESEILNVHFLDGQMDVHYAGKHRRFLAPIFRIRSYFEKHFQKVDLYDAVNLTKVELTDDSCESTRYIVVARK